MLLEHIVSGTIDDKFWPLKFIREDPDQSFCKFESQYNSFLLIKKYAFQNIIDVQNDVGNFLQGSLLLILFDFNPSMDE